MIQPLDLSNVGCLPKTEQIEIPDKNLIKRVRLNHVWSLSSFEVRCQLLTNDLYQVSSVSLLVTSSTALANKGLFDQILAFSPDYNLVPR